MSCVGFANLQKATLQIEQQNIYYIFNCSPDDLWSFAASHSSHVLWIGQLGTYHNTMQKCQTSSEPCWHHPCVCSLLLPLIYARVLWSICVRY